MLWLKLLFYPGPLDLSLRFEEAEIWSGQDIFSQLQRQVKSTDNLRLPQKPPRFTRALNTR